MSKSPLYVKLKGDEFAEGEISIDLSRKVTCITGEIDLMKLLRHITVAARINGPTDFHNRLSGITRLEWSIRHSKEKQEYGVSKVTALFEFASTVIGRQFQLHHCSSSFKTLLKTNDRIEMVSKLGQDAQYLINWAADILASFYYEAGITLENCDKLFAVPYPEAFLSPAQQSRIMPALLKLLPNARFVIATQSPVILTTISSNPKDYHIYKMEVCEDNFGSPNKIRAQEYQNGIYGAEMNEAHKMFYDMGRAVPEVDQLLQLLQEQIKAKSFNEADITVKQLESMIGHSDRELMRLTGILDTRKMLVSK